MATLSMVSVPIAPSSLSLSTRGRSSSVSFPAPKVSAIFSHHPALPSPSRPPVLALLVTTVCVCLRLYVSVPLRL